jgi:hypothetical protein
LSFSEGGKNTTTKADDGQLVGYARVSTRQQDLALQLDALNQAGCERIFRDVGSGTLRKRPRLDTCLEYLRSGDTLVVWRLDRLGRSLRHLVDVIAALERRHVAFHSLREAIDTTTNERLRRTSPLRRPGAVNADGRAGCGGGAAVKGDLSRFAMRRLGSWPDERARARAGRRGRGGGPDDGRSRGYPRRSDTGVQFSETDTWTQGLSFSEVNRLVATENAQKRASVRSPDPLQRTRPAPATASSWPRPPLDLPDQFVAVLDDYTAVLRSTPLSDQTRRDLRLQRPPIPGLVRRRRSRQRPADRGPTAVIGAGAR